MKMQEKDIAAVDLFCGVGGLAYGMHSSGINVAAGIDIDKSCRYAFEENCNATFIEESVAEIDSKKVKELYKGAKYKVLVGCAPCQPFSTYTLKADKRKDSRWQLLNSFSRLIDEIQPDIISMENVPRLAKFKQAPVFKDFVENLRANNYHVWYDIVYCPDYGIPQKRKRLVLLASKHGEISLIPPTHSKENYVTVKQAIGKLKKIKAGESDNNDFFHRASALSELNLKRIRASKPGGSWKNDWSEELILDCHKDEKRKSYGSIYGRMNWDEPSPTMTTFCTGIGNGRFGHPEQDRAISLREAAILQSFPKEYKFVRNKEDLSVRSISRHIGNAVPPKLGEVIGESILLHLNKHKNGKNTTK
tara:strand:+ start:470 stop:1555 length:1086 start_codon:yes stop_codon:yes gene_type:complete